jgi:hypothetical protein
MVCSPLQLVQVPNRKLSQSTIYFYINYITYIRSISFVFILMLSFSIVIPTPHQNIDNKASSPQRLAPALSPEASPNMSRRVLLPFFALLAIAVLMPCFVGGGTRSGNGRALRAPRQATTSQSVALVQVTKEKLGVGD